MLNKICTDLETSKRLKELELEKELEIEGGSFFTWWFSDFTKSWVLVSEDGYMDSYIDPEGKLNIKAYTFEQILYMLPYEIICNCVENPFYIEKSLLDIHNRIGYKNTIHSHYQFFQQEDKNLVTTAARLLIKLKEDKII